MTDYYIRLKFHEFEDDTMEVHVPWVKDGCLLMGGGSQLAHYEDEDERNFKGNKDEEN